jgi:secernin
LQARVQRLEPADLMAVLRDHGVGAGQGWNPGVGLMNVDVCMHAGYGMVRHDQTTGSMVSSLGAQDALHFLTGTAAPCTSLFKPMWLDADLPDMGPAPTGKYDPATLFWRHECLHRLALRDYPALAPLFHSDRDKLEADFIRRALAARDRPAAERAAIAAACLAEGLAAEGEWLARLEQRAPGSYPGWLYSRARNTLDQQAQMPPACGKSLLG